MVRDYFHIAFIFVFNVNVNVHFKHEYLLPLFKS